MSAHGDAGQPFAVLPVPAESYAPGGIGSDAGVSVMTPSVAAHVRAIWAGGSPRLDRFSRCGDSMTATDTDLGAFVEDASQMILDAFAGELATVIQQYTGSFARNTLAAQAGWKSIDIVGGSPSPLQQELTAWNPSIMLVAMGTNDITELGNPDGPNQVMTSVSTLVAACLSAHCCPVFLSIPTMRRFGAQFETAALSLGSQLRTYSETHRLPFLDVYGQIDPLPNHGLSEDNVHPVPYIDPVSHGYRPGWFTPAAIGLPAGGGSNVRNLLQLRQLAHILQCCVRI